MGTEQKLRPSTISRKAAQNLIANPLYLAGFITLLAGEITMGRDLEGIACRSVHLGYKAPAGTAFYNEITVDSSAEGTYFMVCGFRMGYFGIQELSNKGKVVIFSVWDPGSQNDPDTVKQEQRVRVLHQGENVRAKRFGGEGTGGQSFFDYDWNIGERYRFLVTAEPHEDRTSFSGFFYLPESESWKHLVTFETISGGKQLEGCYSFVEDFKRNRISTTHPRRARFGNAWMRDTKGTWHELTAARFTADQNPVLNIDGGVTDRDFFLVTGGDTTNANTPLWDHMTRPTSSNAAPTDLPKQ